MTKKQQILKPKTTKQITIFIDESGTLPDPKDKVVIVAAVGTKLPEKLTKVSKSVRRFLKSSKKAMTEIKFYKAGERTKRRFLQELAKQKVEIFTLTVEKYNQKIPDTPENFAFLCWLLLEDCFVFYKNQVKKIIFDRHFHKAKDQKEFNQILTKLLRKKLPFQHVNSQQDSRVNAADMIAGSLLWLETGKDKKFYELIKNQVISKRVLNWKEVRRKFFKEKISSNRRKRPSKRD